MRQGPRLRKSNSAPSLLSMEVFADPTVCGVDAGWAGSAGGRQPWHQDQDLPPPGGARLGLRWRPPTTRRAAFACLPSVQHRPGGLHAHRGHTARVRPCFGQCPGFCEQGRTRKSALCGEGASGLPDLSADGGGRTGTWTAWSSSRIPSRPRRQNTSARSPCAMASVSIRSEPHVILRARAKNYVVPACECHATKTPADSC